MHDMSFGQIRAQVQASGKEADPARVTGAAKVLQAAMRASRNTRFVALPVTCRRAAGQPEFYESAIIIERVVFTVFEPGFTIGCRVYLQSASGKRAQGFGVAVKGRKDKFEAHVGAGLALRHAMEGAFTVLGQKEGTDPGPSPFAGQYWASADSLLIDSFAQLEGTEILCHSTPTSF